MTCGPWPVRIWLWSSAKVTSGDPVQAVLDGPAPADRIRELGGSDVVVGHVGDRVHGFAAAALVGKGPTGPGDLDRQRGLGELDPGGDGVRFHRPCLDPAVALADRGISGWDLFPGHGPQLAVQAGLVALGDEDVVSAAPGQIGDVGPLGVQCVGGDDRAGDV